jgi:hypothetical protein
MKVAFSTASFCSLPNSAISFSISPRRLVESAIARLAVDSQMRTAGMSWLNFWQTRGLFRNRNAATGIEKE